jgi:hypothetical protein
LGVRLQLGKRSPDKLISDLNNFNLHLDGIGADQRNQLNGHDIIPQDPNHLL